MVAQGLSHRLLTEEPLLSHDVFSTSGIELCQGTKWMQLVCYHPLATHFEIAQNKPSMSAMQPEQLKTQMPLEKQSTSHMKSLYSTIPAYHKTIDLFKIFSSS